MYSPLIFGDMAFTNSRSSESGSSLGVWISAAEESLKLCRKCSGLTKQSSSMEYLLSPSGLQFRIDLGNLHDSARRGCPLCRIVSAKLQSVIDDRPQLRYLTRRSFRIFSRNVAKRRSRSYKPHKFLNLRIRAPWNDYSGKDQLLLEDFEEIEMHYKVSKRMQPAYSQETRTHWDRLLEFDICACPGDAMADLISARPLTEDMGSAESFLQAREWIEECCSKHDSCPKARHALPTRVIDVGEPESNQPPILFLSCGNKAPYIALSYCWGEPPPKPQPPQPVMTTAMTVDEFTRALPVSLLPQTIKDAIYTTRQLGFRYLWVDVLCILQDDKVDKRKEISKMKEIFSNAVVTISAACSNSCHKGFLYQRPLYRDFLYHRSHNTKPYVSVEYPPFILPFRCPNGKLGSLILHRWMATRAPREPINSRGWTLEERLLSPRVLVYSSIQLLWECQAGMKMQGPNIFELNYQPRLKQMLFDCNKEDRFNPVQGELIIGSKLMASDTETKSREAPKIEELRKNWIEILADYTSRKLTLAEDKLLAISGIAAVFASGFDTSQYKAGIWYTEEEPNFFLLDLLWTVVDRTSTRNVHFTRPSWTWAAVDGGVSWLQEGSPAYVRSKNDVVCQVLECSVVLESADAPFGYVKSGQLKIRGPMKQFRTITSEGSTQCMRLDAKGEKFNISEVLDSQGMPVPSFPAQFDTAMHRVEVEFSTVWALLLLRSMGLLLSPAEEGTYRRVGIFLWNDDEEWFEDADLKEPLLLTII